MQTTTAKPHIVRIALRDSYIYGYRVTTKVDGRAYITFSTDISRAYPDHCIYLRNNGYTLTPTKRDGDSNGG